MSERHQRAKPEEFLAQAEQEERRKRRGQLKVFLGYASGVGKSFQMFDEGRRRRARGEDVVVCACQPSYPDEVQAILDHLENIPTIRIGDCETIDVAAVLQRHPAVALVDGLAYDNPPGSAHEHRWQDVEQLLASGISVITSVNIQYLEKLQDEVEQITGKRALFSIPRGFLDNNADEIVIIDAPAIDSLSKNPTALASAAKEEAHKLSRLRELALLVAAGVVDHQLDQFLHSHGMEPRWGIKEKILVCLTPRSNAALMLESGRRNANRFHGELYAVYVRQPGLSQQDRAQLQKNLDYARAVGAEIETLSGLNAVDSIINFARQKGITQIFVGHSRPEGAWRRLWRASLDRLIYAAEGMDVVVYPH